MTKTNLIVGHRYYLTRDHSATGVYRFQGGKTYWYYFNEVDNMEPFLNSYMFPGYVGFHHNPTFGEVPEQKRTIEFELDINWN